MLQADSFPRGLYRGDLPAGSTDAPLPRYQYGLPATGSGFRALQLSLLDAIRGLDRELSARAARALT